MTRDTIPVTNTAIHTPGGAGSAGVILAPTLPDVGNGAKFDNALGRVLLLIINGLGGSTSVGVTVVILSVADAFGRTGDLEINVAPGEVAVCGPFPPALFNQPSGADRDKVYVEYEPDTGYDVDAFAAVAAIRVTVGGNL